MKDENLILYIDDEQTNLDLFYLSFSRHFNIITCISPFDALDIVKKQPIRIVFSDFKMPLKNGMQLIQEIKQICPEMPCMILSGYVESEVVIDNSLLYKYIMKPWRKQEIIDIINEILALKI